MSGDMRSGRAHVCEPPRWPSSADDLWTCNCGMRHQAFLAKRPIVALGWRTSGLDRGEVSS